jgi:AraC-like DNA-binding protein
MKLLLETVHRSPEGGTMYFREFPPCRPLLPHVACFWSGALHARWPVRYRHRVLPDGCTDIIFNLAPRAPNAVVIGPMWRPRHVVSDGALALGVRFYPGAALRFLDQPLTGLQETVTPFSAFIGSTAGALIDQLMSGGSLGHRVAIVERWLVGRLQRTAKPDPRVTKALKWIYAEKGRLQVAGLAREAGLCERQLSRKFTAWTGYSPKQLIRVMRFQQALATALGPKPESDAMLALQHGYADQSHLIREFQEFGGSTPRTLRRAALDIDDQCPIYSIPTPGTLSYHLAS